VPDGPLVTKPTDDRYRLVDQQGKWRLLTVPPDGNERGACPASGSNTPTAPAPPGSSLGKRPVEVIGTN
jgi:hypothetical protein